MGRQDLLISPPPVAAAPPRNLKHSDGIKSERTFCQIRLYPIYFPPEGWWGGGGGDLLLQHQNRRQDLHLPAFVLFSPF